MKRNLQNPTSQRPARLRATFTALSTFSLGLLAACGGSSATPTGSGGGGSGATAATALGRCESTNPFSKGAECKQYTGAGWSEVTMAADCKAVMGGPGTFTLGAACGFASELGSCAVTNKDGNTYVLHSEGSDAGQCSATKSGCELFAKGVFSPGAVCATDAGGGDSTSGGYGETPFVQPYLTCKDPLPGEPAGHGEGGKVCTYTMISAATEEGRHYEDYASCSDVRTQRPYWSAPPKATTATDDPRLNDAAYMAEVAWAKKQVEASACICCHTDRLAPSGASQWSVDARGVWLDGIRDGGLAMMAGLVPSDAFGAYPAVHNNGFDRSVTGVPTTDVARMRKLLLAEWARRGFTEADAANYEAFGGPLVEQQAYVPTACGVGEGVGADGKVTWSGGSARYVYVLEAGSKNPGAPPNLDEPAGTLWLVDVSWKSMPMGSGLAYGATFGDLRQRVPASGPPAALTPGKAYLLYVLKAIGFPLARGLFTAR